MDMSDADKRRMIYIYTAYKSGWHIHRGSCDAEVIISKPTPPRYDVMIYFIDMIDIFYEIFV